MVEQIIRDVFINKKSNEAALPAEIWRGLLGTNVVQWNRMAESYGVEVVVRQYFSIFQITAQNGTLNQCMGNARCKPSFDGELLVAVRTSRKSCWSARPDCFAI